MNNPTKNKTAYYYYSKEMRHTSLIKDIPTKKEVNNTIRSMWKNVKDKTKWERLATEDKQRYLKEKIEWDKHVADRDVGSSEPMICKIGTIELGLCCLNNTLSKAKIFPNRTCVLKTALLKGKDYVKSLAIRNLKDVLTMLDWNHKNGISSYRLSSNMFPHCNNAKFDGGYTLDFADDLLKQIGKKSKEYGIRLSMHPGHFNHIGAKSEKVFENTVDDLKHHCDILDRIEKDLDFGFSRGILCVHGGGTYGDKEASMKRWVTNFKKLPYNIQMRICIENCEKSYNSEDCLKMCQELNIPHIFDVHHYNCFTHYNKDTIQKTAEELIPLVLETWDKRCLKPYFHISEQGNGPIGKHSEYVEEIPAYLLNIEKDITLDIEAKGKEKAIFYLTKKYSKKSV